MTRGRVGFVGGPRAPPTFTAICRRRKTCRSRPLTQASRRYARTRCVFVHDAVTAWRIGDPEAHDIDVLISPSPRSTSRGRCGQPTRPCIATWRLSWSAGDARAVCRSCCRSGCGFASDERGGARPGASLAWSTERSNVLMGPKSDGSYIVPSAESVSACRLFLRYMWLSAYNGRSQNMRPGRGKDTQNGSECMSASQEYSVPIIDSILHPSDFSAGVKWRLRMPSKRPSSPSRD